MLARLPLMLALVSPVSADVWIVDSTGKGDFTRIQPAVDAAADGDLILVRPFRPDQPGPYDAFEIVDKELDVFGEPGTKVYVNGFTIRDLGAGRVVTVSDFVPMEVGGQYPEIIVEACAGSVRLTRIRAPILEGYWPYPVEARAKVLDCADVAIVACRLGAHGLLEDALFVEGSQIAIHESELHGGNHYLCEPGSHGLEARASTVWLANSYLVGGVIRDWCDWCCEDPGDGAHLADGTVGAGGDNTFSPGWSGSKDYFPCPYCYICGDELELQGGSTFDLFQPSYLRLSRPKQLGGVVDVEVAGEPGASVYLEWSDRCGFDFEPGRNGVRLLGDPVRGGLLLGEIPAGGILAMPFRVDALPEGADRTFLQARLTLPGGETSYTNSVVAIRQGLDILASCDRSVVVFVDADAPVGGDGESWASAYPDLEDGLARANGIVPDLCDTIPVQVWVAEGTYTPQSGQPFRIGLGTALYGGFSGTETYLRERDPATFTSVLSGDKNGDDDQGELGDNLDEVVVMDEPDYFQSTSLLDGFTVRDSLWVAVVAWSGDVRGCVIRDNHRRAVSCWGGEIVDCSVFGNGHPSWGGVLSCTDARIVNCRIRGNVGSWGAAVNSSGSLEVIGCEITGNNGGNGPGGIYASLGPGHVVRIEDTTVFGNTTTADTGAGVRIWADETGWTLHVRNSILWMNDANGSVSEVAQLELPFAGREFVAYTCIQGLSQYQGPGNHAQDPLFVDPFGPDGVAGTADDDLRLGAGSPCVDAGANLLVPPDLNDVDLDGTRYEPLPLDVAGLPRFTDDPDVTDTGEGPGPVVDMGAHERQPD